MSEVRNNIMKQLMHNPKLRFNELWNKQGTSNSFAYHLKLMEEEGLVVKSEEYYSLTEKGKQTSAYIAGLSGIKQKFPLLIVAIIIQDGNKLLLQQRKKEPFFGYWNLPSGKVNFDQSPIEAAQTELLEETGLKIPLTLKGIRSVKTFNDGDLAYNHQIFTFLGEYDGSEIIADKREGTLQWFTLEEIKTIKALPNLYDNCSKSLESDVRWIISNRYQEKGVFVDREVLFEQKL